MCREMTPCCRRPAGCLFAENSDAMNKDMPLNTSGGDLARSSRRAAEDVQEWLCVPDTSPREISRPHHVK